MQNFNNKFCEILRVRQKRVLPFLAHTFVNIFFEFEK